MLDELWAAQHLTAAAAPEFQPGNLEAKFVAPPFTVLDTRQGYWQERRRSWLSLGIKSELGRGADLLSLSPAEGARARWSEALPASTTGKGMAAQVGAGVAATTARRAAMERQMKPGYREQAGLRSGEGRALEPGKGNARTDFGAYATNEAEGAEGGTSIFDPVLCELMYRWFAPDGGAILDPFAGGSVRGIVAAKLGHPYTGIDLSLAQLEANRRQAALILGPEPAPSWLHGDSRTLEALLPAGELYDMVMTCPPYFDLEVYSDDPADLSNAGEYSAFLEGYAEVIHRAAQRLRPDRFAVLVVSEIRDPAGYCRGFVADTVRAGEAAGLRLYNEAILVNSAGSLPLRVTKYMESSRKLGRAHQNVLCFIKGKPPRGWSYDRAAPPSPQLSLALEPELVPAPEPVFEPAAVVPVEPLQTPTRCEDHEDGYHLTQADADECAAETYGEAGWIAAEPEPEAALVPSQPALGHAEPQAPEAVPSGAEPAPPDPEPLQGVESMVQLEDGRWADRETGELFADSGAGEPGEPVRPLVPATRPAPPKLALITDLQAWACAACGQPPTGPLSTTVLPDMARGACDNCGRAKVYRRAR